MTPSYDLVLLTGGIDDIATLRTLLTDRVLSLRIRKVKVDYQRHPRRDPGCFNEAPAFLEGYLRKSNRALVVFDREGSGQEGQSALALEDDLRTRLRRAGWGDRAEVVVIDPELEVWIWAGSDHVARTLGWEGSVEELRKWLEGKRGLWTPTSPKPSRPKECVELTLEHTHRPRAPALYSELGHRVGLDRCQDPAFHRLRAILRRWFPLSERSRSP